MTYLQKILDDPITLLASFFIVVFAVKECMEIWKYFKSRGKEMYDKDAEISIMKTEIEGVKATQVQQGNALHEVQDSLGDIADMIKALEVERKADSVAQGRAMLYDLYNQLKDRETLTLGEYEVIQDVFNRYEKSGGNGTFKKISHVLLSKPIEE